MKESISMTYRFINGKSLIPVEIYIKDKLRIIIRTGWVKWYIAMGRFIKESLRMVYLMELGKLFTQTKLT